MDVAHAHASREKEASKPTSVSTTFRNNDPVEQLTREIDAFEERFRMALSDQDGGVSQKNLQTSIAVANSQALLLMNRFHILRALPDIDKAIERLSYAASAPPCEGITRDPLLWSLSNILLRRYNEWKSPSDLDAAIQWMDEACTLIASDSPDRPHVFRMLSSLLHRRFQQSQAMEDLERAIQVIKDEIETTDTKHPLYANMARMLGTNLLARYERTGNESDLDQGMARVKEAVNAVLPGDPAREGICDSMAEAHLKRYDRLGQLDDIEQAVYWGEEAIREPLLSSHVRSASINTLSAALFERFQSSWMMDDVDRGIDLAEEGLRLAPSYDQANILNTLGGQYMARYRATGRPQDLDQAIKANRGALLKTPDDNPKRASYIQNLSQLLSTRFNRYGDQEDLEQGARRATEALAATPPDDPVRPWRCSCVASFAVMRYQRSDTLGDLDKAIDLSEEAILKTLPTYVHRFQICSTLTTALNYRYQRTKNIEDLQTSIKWSREIYSGIKCAGNDRARAAHLLALLLVRRFDLTEDRKDIDEAQEVIKKALSETPAEFEARHMLDTSMAHILERLYDAYNDPENLEQAIELMGNSLAARPLEAPDRAQGLHRRAEMVMRRYQRTPSGLHFYLILRDLYEAWHSHFAGGRIRIRAARLASTLLIEKRRWQEAYALLDNAVRLLPVVLSSRSFVIRGDQEYKMSTINELAPLCASVGFHAGEEAFYCLRILELGRGVIMGSIIDRRSDLSELRSKHPQSYDKYHRLRTLLDISVSVTASETSINGLGTLEYEQVKKERENAVNDFEETLASIREFPGFEGFQLPPRSEELMSMAREGPIIMVNSTTLRSDAIIVTTTYIRSLSLLKLTYHLVKEKMAQMAQIVKGRPSTYRDRNDQMKDILLWLWNDAVEPILDVLGFRPDGNLPRIWWVGVGALAPAPFHAAGDHSSKSTRNTMSYAISSYIPTIKALAFAREKALELKSDFRLLLVSMPTTPGHNNLPGAEIEVKKIIESVKGKATPSHLLHPSTTQVLDSLPSSNAVHFSCHGISDSQNPSNSHLLLCKDGNLDKLSVDTITNTNLKHAQIAYLSACSTADNASDAIPDESIYIASGFQLAGFSHVLATKWESNDAACQKVAVDFYAKLLSKPVAIKQYKGHNRVGAAFHYAVEKLRREHRKEPIKWAPYIHTGA